MVETRSTSTFNIGNGKAKALVDGKLWIRVSSSCCVFWAADHKKTPQAEGLCDIVMRHPGVPWYLLQ